MPRLENTNETLHASVRIRMGKKGLGYDDKGSYDSEALKNWTMVGQMSEPDTPVRLEIEGEAGHMKNVKWEKHIKNDKGQDETLILPEDKMGEFEKKILKLWPEIYDGFDNTMPGNHKKNIQRAETEPTMNGHSTGIDVAKPDPQKRKSRDSGALKMSPGNIDGVDVDYHPNRVGTL